MKLPQLVQNVRRNLILIFFYLRHISRCTLMNARRLIYLLHLTILSLKHIYLHNFHFLLNFRKDNLIIFQIGFYCYSIILHLLYNRLRFDLWMTNLISLNKNHRLNWMLLIPYMVFDLFFFIFKFGIIVYITQIFFLVI